MTSDTAASGEASDDGDKTAADAARGLGVSVPGAGSARAASVGVALAVAALVVWTRGYLYPAVFREGSVVLTANDPYAYRYYVETVLSASSGPLDLGTMTALPTGEPLFLATLWFAASLAGGGEAATGAVLAWYPVVAALLTVGIVYVLGARVLGDRRVGLAAAVCLALVPAFAFRTSVGFADHHAFDYVWATATLTALAWVVGVDDDPFGPVARRGAALLGVCLAGLTLAWEGSPLLLLAVAGYLAVAVPLDVSDGRSPMRANAPVLLGTGVAAGLTMGAHLALGWHTVAVAVVPSLLLVGGVGLAGVGEFVRRGSLSVRALAGAELGGPVVGLTVMYAALPETVGELLGGVAFLLFRSNIAEKAPTFTPGNAFGLEFFGAVLVLGLPVFGWAARRALLGDRRWLAVTVYAGWVGLLTALQIRFAGHFAPVLAVFAGIAVVWLFARDGLTAVPAPVRRPVGAAGSNAAASDGGAPSGSWFERDALTVRSAVTVVVVVALVVGTSGVFLPGEVEAGIVEDDTYRTATWMGEYADARDWTYPEDYVFSRWGANRVYNYFTNGESGTYVRARETYTEFVYDDATASAEWYERLRGDTGFVVVEQLERRPGTIQKHLYVTSGSRWERQGYEAVSHYRAVYASPSATTKVFTLVPGATVTGSAPANATVDARTTVEIPGDSFEYRQRATAGPDGTYRLVVPYPGAYEVTVGNESRSVRVPESAVGNGTRVAVGG